MTNFFKRFMTVFKGNEDEPVHHHTRDISEGDEGIDDEII
jgi:hypothetical protein